MSTDTGTTPSATSPAATSPAATSPDDAADTPSSEGEPRDVVLDVSDAAVAKILEIRADEDEPEAMGLQVAITGVNGVDFVYDLSFEPLADVGDDRVVYTVGELPMIVPVESVEQLAGATLDLPSSPVQGGLVIKNPNRPDLLGEGELDLTGTLEEKVSQLLSQRINPSLAAHGGYTDLVRVDGTVVYLTMGGGCQGCAMSAATLREGISVMIAQAIPEVSDVVDITDHDAGATPYFS